MQQKLMTISNRIAYLVFCGIWAMAYLFYREYVFLVLLIFMLFLCPVSIGAAFYLRKRVAPFCSFDREQIQKNEPYYLKIALQNPTPIATKNVILQVKLENPFAREPQVRTLIMPLRAGKTTEVRMKCVGICCGKMSCRIMEYEITDWLGLVSLKGRKNGTIAGKGGSFGEMSAVAQTEIRVLPKLIQITETLEREGSGEGDTEISIEEKKGSDTAEVISLREYMPGDRQQAIHWKLSAKAEDFFVKEYGSTVNNEITLLLDLPKEDSDSILELFFSIGISLCDRGLIYRAVYMENGELCTDQVTSEDDLNMVLAHVYDTLPAEVSAQEEYTILHPEPVGAVLLVCGKTEFTQLRETVKEVCAEYGEAVAAWI